MDAGRESMRGRERGEKQKCEGGREKEEKHV